jgi:hypothetical protein
LIPSIVFFVSSKTAGHKSIHAARAASSIKTLPLGHFVYYRDFFREKPLKKTGRHKRNNQSGAEKSSAKSRTDRIAFDRTRCLKVNAEVDLRIA